LTKIERILVTKTPLALLFNASKKLVLPGFEGMTLYAVLRFFRRQLKGISLAERTAAISYNFIMAIPPSMLFLFTLIPNLPFITKTAIQEELHRIINDIVTSKTYNTEMIKFVDAFIFENRIGLLSFGLLFSLFFASNAMMGLIRAFNRMHYPGFKKRKGLNARWTAIKLTILIFTLFLAYFMLLILQGNLLDWVVSNPTLKWMILNTRWILILLLVFVSVGFIFKYAPSLEKRWKIITPGSITTTVLCAVSSLVFSYFVNHFARYNVLYGSIGTVMMVMALIYINSIAILIGFELNVSIKSVKLHESATH
jgi:membrane protein